MNLGRLVILNSILLGLLIFAFFLGYLSFLWEADKFWAVPIIGGLTAVGVGMLAQAAYCRDIQKGHPPSYYLATRRSEGALWLADKLPVVGLALTVIGLLWASNGDLEAISFKRDMIHALIGNLMGVLGYGWLELCARVCR